MKLFNLIWVLGLAGATAACNTGDPVSGCAPGEVINDDGMCVAGGGPGGGGGSAGSGGTGGVGEGACTGDADTAVYADLTYTDGDGGTHDGPDAASQAASDCVFESPDSVPPIVGCTDLALAVLRCAPSSSCTPEEVGALADCVETCMQDTIETVTGSQLSAECAGCYSESVACSANLCATSGCNNPNSPGCIQCRCENDCTPGFDRCSGLPPSGDCN